MARTRTSTSPAPARGGGNSASCIVSGSPNCWTWIAFMAGIMKMPASREEDKVGIAPHSIGLHPARLHVSAGLFDFTNDLPRAFHLGDAPPRVPSRAHAVARSVDSGVEPYQPFRSPAHHRDRAAQDRLDGDGGPVSRASARRVAPGE